MLGRLRNRWLRMTGGFRPEVVIFDITHACNSRCRGCGYRDAAPDELPWRRWCELAAEARCMGFAEVLLTGGEPLAHPDFDAIVTAVASELPVSVHTNGLLLRRKAGVLDVCEMLYVSLDALDDTVHRRLRGVPVEPVLRGLEQVGAPVHLRVTVWPENLDELLPIADYAARRGYAVSYLAADTSGTAFGQVSAETRRLDVGDLREALEPLYGHPAVASSRYALDRIAALASGRASSPRCRAPWTSGVVGPTGTWQPCFFLPVDGDVRGGLAAAVQASARDVDVARTSACRRCVCWR